MYKAEQTGGNTALVLLVPIRLGSDSLNTIYIPCIKVSVVLIVHLIVHYFFTPQALLSMDHCIGIIGGRPKHSVYFVGFQENKLLYLDPHYVQKRVDMSRPDFDLTVWLGTCLCYTILKSIVLSLSFTTKTACGQHGPFMHTWLLLPFTGRLQ